MTEESPRVSEMTEKHAQVAFESIRNFNIFRVEAEQVHEVISSLASGRLQTYSPESEVRISREALEYYAMFCRECATMANQWERPQQANQFERVHDAIRGWLGLLSRSTYDPSTERVVKLEELKAIAATIDAVNWTNEKATLKGVRTTAFGLPERILRPRSDVTCGGCQTSTAFGLLPEHILQMDVLVKCCSKCGGVLLAQRDGRWIATSQFMSVASPEGGTET